MKTIPLTRGKIALVDDLDFEELSKYKWHAVWDGYNWYAAHGHKCIKMHRVILGLKSGDGKLTDHKNSNSLDNRRCNLRFCTNAENLRNSNKYKGNTSGFKGVSWHKLIRKWLSRLCYNYKIIHLGYFDSKIEAAYAYDRAAIKYFGEFAKLNFPHIRGD